jgi:hypothetical protein
MATWTCSICLQTLDLLRRVIADWDPPEGKTVKVEVPCPYCGRPWAAIAYHAPPPPPPDEHFTSI